MLLAAIIVLGIGLYYLGPLITGFAIKEFSYADDLNLVVASSGNYTWQLSGIGELKSAKIDGRVTKSGKARVYIEDNGARHLIFDSSRIGEKRAEEGKAAESRESADLITGFLVKDGKEDKEKGGKGKDENKTETDEDKKKKNHKPDWTSEADEFIINGTTAIDLSQYFVDEDKDALIYAASEAEGLSIKISNEIITIIPTSENNFNTTITFTASDGIDSKKETVNLIVYAAKPAPTPEPIVQPNMAPVWNSGIDAFIVNGTTSINLSQHFIDEDNDSLAYGAGLAENITITISNDLAALIPAEGFAGNAAAAFSAFDGKNLTIKIVTLTVPQKAAVGIAPANETDITQKINRAPKWISDADSFTLNKTLSINLSQYFADEDNDSLSFNASDAADVSESISGSTLTLTAISDNFNSTIEITASDGNLSAGKEVKLIVPLAITLPINETILKAITIDLAYKSGTIYDANDNGEESVNGVVDLTVENAKFNWGVDESRLCTRWEVYNAEEGQSTIFCNGNKECCAFVGLLPTRSSWSEVYYAVFGKDGAGHDNIVSAQALYYDVNLSVENPKSEIYYSSWANKSAKFFDEEVEFSDECIETCLLSGLNKSSYTLIFEIEDDAVLRIDRIKYSLLADAANNPPLLLKNFSAINASKNKNATINLSQYFADPDGDALSYGYYKADNITILFNGDIATILPDKGISGERFSYITANDSEKTAVSDVFMINITEEKFKPKVEVGKPVKWQSKVLIDVGSVSSVNLTLPETASNITIRVLNETIAKELPDEKIKVIEDGKVKDKEIFEAEKKLENIRKKISILEEAKLKGASKVAVDDGDFGINEIGQKLDELYAKKSELERQLSLLPGASLITGNAIALTEATLNETLPVLFINESLTRNIEIEVSYETEAPIAIEDEINAYTRQVKIISETSYEDVLSWTTLNDAPQQAIKLYWIQNDEKVLFENVDYIDSNSNGLIDRIEWIIPHLSNQTFEVSITILNVQSYPTVYGNWTVVFNTTGTGNLTIYGYNGTSYAEVPDDSSTINDLEYLETRCNDAVLNTTIVCANGEQMPYDIYKLKKRIAEIKKRLNELNRSG